MFEIQPNPEIQTTHERTHHEPETNERHCNRSDDCGSLHRNVSATAVTKMFCKTKTLQNVFLSEL